jgi:hypothetical protein
MRVFNIFLWKEADCSILYILQPVNGHGELTGTFHLKNNTMLKKLLLAGSLFIVVAAKADDGTKIVSKVQKVIVFLNGAQVTRTASVNISAGTSTLVFENLSPGIDEQSIQVQADGDFTILSVKSELNYLSEELKEKNVEELRDQQKIIKDKISTKNDDLSVNGEEENMLLKNQSVKGDNTELNIVKLKEALDFEAQQLTEIRKNRTLINNEIRDLDIQLQKYNKQIAEILGGNTSITGNILVTVSSKTALETGFTLNYVVHNASWYPTYDIRAKNVNSPISISYKANVSQQSGEDWKNIKLTLSTGNPAVSGNKPELSPYYLNFGMTYSNQYDKITSVSGMVKDEHNQPLPGATITVAGTSIGSVSDANGRYNIQVPDGHQMLTFRFIGYEKMEIPVNSGTMDVNLTPSRAELDEVSVVGYGSQRRTVITGAVASISQGDVAPVVNLVENQTNVQFDIDNPYSIPSDGKQYTVEINQVDVPATYQYTVAPKLSTDVFLSANITDWNKYNFLPGEANLFFEGTFIGKSLLNSNAAADTLNISLGTDKNIVVTRTLQKELTQKESIGSNKKDTRDWLIEVKNRKNQPVSLLVEDQVPVSQNSAINVEAQELSGGNVDANTGKVTWNMNLKPQDDKKLELKYQVKYPKNQSIIVE